MADNLLIALQITLVGMGIVFGAILLVALMMLLLVRLTAASPAAALPQTRQARPQPARDVGRAAADDEEQRRKRAAAAVAVSQALARRNAEPGAVPTLPPAPVSPWQAVMRGRQLKQRGPR
jgi:Na+-transporting methylmalonyl-CoA/oxaloacetate decarboxylase gamma subunit